MNQKRVVFWVCLVGLILILNFVCTSHAKTAKDVAQKVFPSVVMLVMEDSNGQPLSLGSGFFVQEDVVATNLHVIEGAAGGYAKIVGEKQKYNIAGYVAIDHKIDLVLLKIEKAKAPPIDIGDSNTVEIGDEIFAVGNPKGLEGTFSKGIISAIRKFENDSLLQITAPISPGSSGGPVLNKEGKIIGIAVATFKGGQNLNFAIPASYLSPLLSDIKPLQKLSAKKKTKKKVKSILADLGGKNTEGVEITHFRWSNASYTGYYEFSLRNNLREPIKKVSCLIVFYDNENEPLDFDTIYYYQIIPGRLAKRITKKVDGSVQELTTKRGERIPNTKVEFRILGFQIVEESDDEL